MSTNLPSKENLCLIYKAILTSLVISCGIKHSWLAVQIGMRSDSFSKWFNSAHRSLSLEETKLFCDALKIPNETIEMLLSEILLFRLSSVSLVDFAGNHSEEVVVAKLILYFGKEGFMKLMLLIDEQIKKFSKQLLPTVCICDPYYI